jgi:hypothetical protein
MDFPTTSHDPVDEYGDKRIFALSFPWLFPGGLGDIKDFPGSMNTWGRNMLYYKDARFTTDKIFSFFAMNYISRHRNSSSGHWFVSDFNKNCPETLEDLHNKIASGNTSFINQINYYNARVKGLSPYWQKKQQELYTWINHHVEEGNGAPMFFITLSCAEYFWADVVDLLQDRFEMAGIDASDVHPDSPSFVQIVNDYSIVIQEYFQIRTEKWLETVGKQIFGIKHYWVRYEFAPGRGQIHAHLLAIPEDQSIYHLCHEDMKQPNGKEIRARRMAEWAKDKFGLTASVEEGYDDIHIDKKTSPTCLRFQDIPTDKESTNTDTQCLLRYVQHHICSNFCLRAVQNSKR